MPSLPQQIIPVAGVQRIELPATTKLAVLKITNESINAMQYRDKQTLYGDPIAPNGGSNAYHIVDKDIIPHVFWIVGTAADTFAVYYQEDS